MSYAGGAFPGEQGSHRHSLAQPLPDWYGELTDVQLATLQPPGRSNRAMVSNGMQNLPVLKGGGAKL